MEIDIVSVEEALWDMGRLVWIAGVFRISGAIDSSKGDFSTMGIAEVALLNRESQGSHDVRMPDSRTAITQEPAPKGSRSCKSREETSCQPRALKDLKAESSIDGADVRVAAVTGGEFRIIRTRRAYRLIRE